ncbi:MAG: TlpA family protein disulfide reductase [Firmicutes bacterium]|nr:TlpA family protein disulfide reductase [Bacillota bacterium]MCM1401827.1 TlpA family protein disulfide reductase [Bacteroides sp.]MCM1477937.1 TlpA family protein disulfide reductase [Bacteroides sp.]
MCRTLLFTLLIGLASCINDDVPEIIEHVGTGDRVPTFTLGLTNGLTIQSTDYSGAPWGLLFFSVNCPDCQRLLPEIDKLHAALPDFPLLCVSREPASDIEVASYWNYRQLSLPYIVPVDKSVYHLFATAGVPRLYIIDASGTIVQAYSNVAIPDFNTLASVVNSLGSPR